MQNRSWALFCNLDYWIDEMDRKDQNIPKWVLKMAMKHVRDEIRFLYDSTVVFEAFEKDRERERCKDAKSTL
jgi:hypothetical protein